MTDQSEHLPNILPHHLRRLRESGLNDSTIVAAGIRSESKPEALAILLNASKIRKGIAPAIVIPFTDASGQNGYCRIRPDTPRTINLNKVKYESPKGMPNKAYFPPGVAPKLDDPQVELIFTEGEFKALAGTQAGFATIGLVGVFGWKEKGGEHLLPELERIPWKGRNVFIAFDSDLPRKADVQLAETRLAKHLTDRGAVVRCVRLPDGPAGEDGQPTKAGLDDFLLLHGLPELRKVLDNGVEPEVLQGPDTKADAAKIDPSVEARAYCNRLQSEGIPRLRFWRGTWWLWRKGAYRECEAAEVRADLLINLDRYYHHLPSGSISCVLDHLRAQSILFGDTEPVTWLAESPAGWQPDDVLVTRRHIIHLPTLVANGADAIQPATPSLFTTAALDFDFDPQAPQPDAWFNFLLTLWPEDSQSINTLQEFIGYLLTLDTRQQKIALLVGPPRSGKGTIGRVIRELVGRANVVGPTLASIGTHFGLAPLVGKSVAIISDARLSWRTDSATVVERLLSISGEDALSIDRKFLPPITCKLPTRLVILTNELPNVADSSGAMSSRFIVFQLRESFLGRENHGLFETLKGELPAILLWSIEGWRRLHERGFFVQPPSGQELVGDMADLTSPIGAFVRQQCVIASAASVPRSELYAAYRTWAESSGKKHIDDSISFGRALRAAVPSVGDSQPTINDKRTRCYTGIELA